MFRRTLALVLFGWAIALSAADTANGVQSLRRFFAEVNRYTAHFSQTVLDESDKPIQEAKGRLWIERPNKFRWNYESPAKQQVVSDGESLYVYDEDLKQVTVRSLKQGLLDTPAMLLAGRGRIDDQFVVKDAGREKGLDWAELTPKRKDSGVDQVRIGFVQGRWRMFEITRPAMCMSWPEPYSHGCHAANRERGAAKPSRGRSR